MPFVCAHEIRRRRISGLSRQTFVSAVKKVFDLLFFDATRQDFRYFEIDNELSLSLSPSPHESSLVLFYRRDARTFPHEIEKHRTGWRSWIPVTRVNSQRWFTFTLELFPSLRIEIHSGIRLELLLNDFKGAVKPISS